MNDVLSKQLENFGLSEKEAKIYVALTELEIATANQIAEHADLKRSSTYVVLDSLIAKGLVSISEDKTVKRYVATSPEMLMQEINAEIQQRLLVKEGLQRILPELKALHKDTRKKPKIRVYEGKKGIIASFEETLECRSKEMRVVSSVTKLSKILPLYFPNYVKRRIANGIKMYGIHPDDMIAKTLMKTIPNSLDEPILIPAKEYKFPADFAIFDDTIAYMTSENGGFAVSIESKEMAEVAKSVFDLAFEQAKVISKSKLKSTKEAQQ